jgi:hypothetical protein
VTGSIEAPTDVAYIYNDRKRCSKPRSISMLVDRVLPRLSPRLSPHDIADSLTSRGPSYITIAFGARSSALDGAPSPLYAQRL